MALTLLPSLPELTGMYMDTYLQVQAPSPPTLGPSVMLTKEAFCPQQNGRGKRSSQTLKQTREGWAEIFLDPRYLKHGLEGNIHAFTLGRHILLAPWIPHPREGDGVQLQKGKRRPCMVWCPRQGSQDLRYKGITHPRLLCCQISE